MEKKQMDEEVEARVAKMMAQRLADEIELRKDEIEAEVQRRVVEARKLMEKELIDEFEKQKQAEFKRQLEKEVGCVYFPTLIFYKLKILMNNQNRDCIYFYFN